MAVLDWKPFRLVFLMDKIWVCCQNSALIFIFPYWNTYLGLLYAYRNLNGWREKEYTNKHGGKWHFSHDRSAPFAIGNLQETLIFNENVKATLRKYFASMFPAIILGVKLREDYCDCCTSVWIYGIAVGRNLKDHKKEAAGCAVARHGGTSASQWEWCMAKTNQGYMGRRKKGLQKDHVELFPPSFLGKSQKNFGHILTTSFLPNRIHTLEVFVNLVIIWNCVQIPFRNQWL